MMVGISFDVHLVAQVGDFAFEWVVGGELVVISLRWLYVLHVFFCFDLYDGGLPEDHI